MHQHTITPIRTPTCTPKHTQTHSPAHAQTHNRTSCSCAARPQPAHHPPGPQVRQHLCEWRLGRDQDRGPGLSDPVAWPNHTPERAGYVCGGKARTEMRCSCVCECVCMCVCVCARVCACVCVRFFFSRCCRCDPVAWPDHTPERAGYVCGGKART